MICSTIVPNSQIVLQSFIMRLYESRASLKIRIRPPAPPHFKILVRTMEGSICADNVDSHYQGISLYRHTHTHTYVQYAHVHHLPLPVSAAQRSWVGTPERTQSTALVNTVQ